MIKKTITYTDFDGNELTEDFFFHLSKAELAVMDIEENGTLQQKLEAIARSNDGKQIMAMFNDILGRAYGVKSADGKRLIKSPSLFEEFKQTEAYSVLFMELISDASYAATFINGIVPADLSEGSVPGRPQPQDYRKKIEDLRQGQREAQVINQVAQLPENQETTISKNVFEEKATGDPISAEQYAAQQEELANLRAQLSARSGSESTEPLFTEPTIVDDVPPKDGTGYAQ